MKKWCKIDDIIDRLASETTFFDVIVDKVTIFSGNTIYNEILQEYTEWSFQVRTPTELQTFQKLWVTYTSEVSQNYARAVDALNRLYNPIFNYDRIESAADGRIQSQKINAETENGINANGVGDSVSTDAGTENTDTYTNAFNSGITDVGTHSSRDSLSFDGRKKTESRGKAANAISYNDYLTEEPVTIEANTYNDNSSSANSRKGIEEFSNDVTVSYSIENPDGTSTRVALGDNFTDGEMHNIRITGNIGVTTSQQMIIAEIEMREKNNLLLDFLKGFMYKNCSYLGYEE